MTKPVYSFVIPVYNSISTLTPLYDGIAALMQQRSDSFEVIFVEDNGSNGSWNKLLELKKAYPEKITLIKLTKNFGQNGATLCGIDMAKGDYILTLDDDLQVHPLELNKLIDFQKTSGADVVYGVSNLKTKSWIRTMGSNFIKRLFLKSDGGSNVGSSIRLITGTIANYLRNHSQDHLFINQVISWYTFDTKFVEIDQNTRSEGKSGYSLLQLFRIALRLIFLYSSIPLKMMIGVCIISSITSLSLAGFYIYRHFVLGQGLGFLVLIVVAIALILASISIMGIYLNRIYAARVKKPHYAVKLKL